MSHKYSRLLLTTAVTRTNQVMLGVGTSTYTLAGLTSAASLGQQGAVTGIVTTDANGNLTSDGGALQASVADHEVASRASKAVLPKTWQTRLI